VEFENLVLERLERPFTDEAEIRHVLLLFHSPGQIALGAADGFEPHGADGLFARGAQPELRVTTPKDTPQYATAGDVFHPAGIPQSQSKAMRATFSCQTCRFGTAPIKSQVSLLTMGRNKSHRICLYNFLHFGVNASNYLQENGGVSPKTLSRLRFPVRIQLTAEPSATVFQAHLFLREI
jgi:hypothetical protein